MTRLIIGLGNPGTKYAGTRHNAGFLFIDRLIDSLRAVPAPGHGSFHLWIAHLEGGEVVYLMKPLTYMNLSGDALAVFLAAHPLEIAKVLVAFDDVALPVGQIRLRSKGSAGGQRGMRHLIEVLDTDEIPRLRIGIHSELRGDRPLPDFVLENFAAPELPLLDAALDRAKEATHCWMRDGMTSAMAKFNSNAPQGKDDSPVSINGGAR